MATVLLQSKEGGGVHQQLQGVRYYTHDDSGGASRQEVGGTYTTGAWGRSPPENFSGPRPLKTRDTPL